MTQAADRVREAGSSFPANFGKQVALGLVVFASLIFWLKLLGREWTCPCGQIFFWHGDLSATHNSQHLSDWYSLLHVTYGLGLFVFIRRMAPHWPMSPKAVTALASSAVWEAVENMPAIISLFNAAGHLPDYSGDSILNSIGDTMSVMLGFFAASRLPVCLLLAFALLIEAVVTLAIGDGLIIGTLRLLGADG